MNQIMAVKLSWGALSFRCFKFGVNYGWVESDHQVVHSWDVEWNLVEMVLLAPSTLPEHNPTRPPLHGAVYFTPTTKSDILPLTDSILHCCTNFTFYRFNSRQSLFSPAALFPLEFPGESRARFKFLPFHIQLRSLKAKGMQGVNLECCQTLLLLETGLLAP